MKVKPGRNDLCHCGSGKKYKRCHLDSDRMLAHPASPASEPPQDDVPEEVVDRPALPHGEMDLRNLAALLAQAEWMGSPKDRKMFKEMRADLEPFLAYMDRQDAIEAASTELEAHREAFHRLLDDADATLKRADALFSEEPFVHLRFTATEVRQALERAGVAMTALSGPGLAPDRILTALLDLADKTRRSRISMGVLLHLPDYVAAGRYLDGWLIQHCAHATGENLGEPNPLLFSLFHHGLQALIRQRLKPQMDLVRKLGVDPDRILKMAPTEIDAFLEEQDQDPKRAAEFHALLESQPELKAMAIAEIEACETGAMDLLNQDDFVGRLLAREEIEPWFPRLLETFREVAAHDPEGVMGEVVDEALAKAAVEVMKPVLSEMARSIFTPARLQDLVQVLREARNERLTTNDLDTAKSILGAILQIEQEVDPGENRFLVVLCLAAVRGLGSGLEESAEPEDDSDESATNR
jgi:hypothetical protein